MVWLAPRGAHDQRGLEDVVEGVVLAPKVVLAQVPSVVAPEDDDGVLGEAELLQGVQDPADLRIDIADAGVVGVAGLAVEFLRWLPRTGPP